MAYSDKEKTDIIDEICLKITNGATLRKSLDESSISYETFFRWIDADESKSKQYARATELRAEAMAEELLSIADTPMEGVTTKTLADGGVEETKADMIQHRKLMIDSRKWLMSKMFPKKYSEKVQNEHTIKVEQPLFGDE